MRRHLKNVLIAAFFVSGLSRADAQDYLFSVPQARMLVTVKPDASVDIAYDLTFQNNPRGHVIDAVDIGTPHEHYNLHNIRASVDGRLLREIRVSQYVKPGFEVHLDRPIPPGRSGKLHVEFNMPDMVYQDTTRKDYASLRITPTWFGNNYVVATTDLQIEIDLPKSVKPDDVLHQGTAFTLKAATDQGAIVGWDFPNTRLTGPHQVRIVS